MLGFMFLDPILLVLPSPWTCCLLLVDYQPSMRHNPSLKPTRVSPTSGAAPGAPPLGAILSPPQFTGPVPWRSARGRSPNAIELHPVLGTTFDLAAGTGICQPTLSAGQP